MKTLVLMGQASREGARWALGFPAEGTASGTSLGQEDKQFVWETQGGQDSCCGMGGGVFDGVRGHRAKGECSGDEAQDLTGDCRVFGLTLSDT